LSGNNGGARSLDGLFRRSIIAAIFALMPANILVVVVDGLRPSALGAYGNTTFDTPALNEFAAQSLLFDSCYAQAVELPEMYRALWCAQDPTLPPDPKLSHIAALQASFPQIAAEAGYITAFIADEADLTSVGAAARFRDVVNLGDSHAREKTSRASDTSGTFLAHSFAGLTSFLTKRSIEETPKLVWFHTRGMYGPWDAPLEFQLLLLDDEDPPPVYSPVPPDFVVQSDADPDAVFRYACAYAAQIMVLDACWQSVLDTLDEFAGHQWLVTLIGARGFPLGEHGRIGGIDARLYSEQLHVPWLIRFPDLRGRLARSSALTSHFDLLPTLMDLIGCSLAATPNAFDGKSILPVLSAVRPPWRDEIQSKSPHACAIRTPAWYLRRGIGQSDENQGSSSTTSPAELFVRPDDHWEANDVAKLCPEVVEELGVKIAASIHR
jgi:arylsulfatase A-like enzyme